MFFLHILILYHLLEEVIFTLYYLYTTTRQYMTFAVLLTGNPVNALGKAIQGGNGVSIVINSKFIRCVPPFSLLVWINNGGSQS